MINVLVLILLLSLSLLFFKGTLKKQMANVIAVFQAGLFAYIAYLYLNNGNIQESFDWISALNLSFVFNLDGISFIFSMLITGIGALVFIYARYYMKKYERTTPFYIYLTLFSGAMLGIVFSGNLIQLFVFWELTSVLSFLLITFFHEKERARKAAFQGLFITLMGGLAMLGGIILIGSVVDSYNIHDWTQNADAIKNSELYTAGLILILVGIFTKSAQFPFHFWLPGAMEAPTPVSSFLHSATMVKAGFFLLLRLHPSLGGTPEWFYILSTAGAITMFIGVYFAILRTEIKSVLAYTTINALGVLTLLMGIDTFLSVKAAILFLIIHAFYKATLFMVAGVIDKSTGTKLFANLGGLRKEMPLVFIFTLLATLSMAGLPPMLGFLGKELIYEAKINIPEASNFILIIGVASNILLVAVSVLFTYKIFIKKPAHKVEIKSKPNINGLIGPGILVILSLIFGLFPQLLGGNIINDALSNVFENYTPVKLKLWHGFNTVFFLSLFTVIAGFIVALLIIKFEKITFYWNKFNERILLFRFTDVFVKAIDSFVSISRKKDKIVQHGYHRYYLLSIFLLTSVLLWSQFFETRSWIFNIDNDKNSFYILIVIVITILASILAMFSNKRLATIAILGVSGYGIALIYLYYSAVDLAITQILVETVVVVLFVIVLQKLPRFAKLSNWKIKVRDLAIALIFGTVMGLLALKATEVNFDSSLYDFYSENSYLQGFGKNVVNVILVDFRGLDTFGEVIVLAIAALGVSVLLSKPKKKKV
ncbi:MAG: pH regulation protein AB [Salinivirgaceae bacterium]|nr:MAG: pH regulation protein AB [Salinivirgaceae bacterium]